MLSSDISIHGFFISLPYRDKSLFQITLIIIEKRSSMESLWDFIFTKRYRKNKNKIGRRRWNKKILWFIIFSTAILISLLCLWSHSLCYFQFHQHRRKRKCGWEEKKLITGRWLSCFIEFSVRLSFFTIMPRVGFWKNHLFYKNWNILINSPIFLINFFNHPDRNLNIFFWNIINFILTSKHNQIDSSPQYTCMYFCCDPPLCFHFLLQHSLSGCFNAQQWIK